MQHTARNSLDVEKWRNIHAANQSFGVTAGTCQTSGSSHLFFMLDLPGEEDQPLNKGYQGKGSATARSNTPRRQDYCVLV